MDRRNEAEKLRKSAESLFVTAAKLVAWADELDPPTRTSGEKPRRTICRACGTEYSGIEYFPGSACESCNDRGETSYLKPKDEPVLQRGVEQDITVDELAAGMATATIAGARDRLAMEAALMTFLEDDPDNDDDDVASTFRGRRG